MGRRYFTCCDHSQVKRGPWNGEEDMLLKSYVQTYGHENWRTLPRQAGLQRCGKSCRLRWVNYLMPGVKRGHFTPEEEATIIKLHEALGNKWSKIAAKLPGRTDNEIKNVWNTRLKKTLPSYTKKKNSVAISASNSVMLSDDQTQGASEEAKDPASPSSLSDNSNDTNNSPVEQVIENADQEQHEVNITQEDVELPSESDYEFWNMIYALTQFECIDEVQLSLVEEAINSSTHKKKNEEIVGGEAGATGMDYNHEFAATHDSSADVSMADGEDLDNRASAKGEQHVREKGEFFFQSWSSSPFS